ncbi:MAG TPA: tetratricopeptide repeat protein [Opitutus sp.]|nr:tetratricopeptide repeat protein [Opitutus sp.]
MRNEIQGEQLRDLFASSRGCLVSAVLAAVPLLPVAHAASPPPALPAALLAVEQATDQTSVSCSHCHAKTYTAWKVTDHANANRRISEREHKAFVDSHVIAEGGSRFELGWQDGHGIMSEEHEGSPEQRHLVEFILGSSPLWQPLVAAPRGRWQPTDMAYDPAKREWFNVFDHENRRPGEWGHWTGRGMNWNSMCAQCHMTGFQKNYHAATDSYTSTWIEQGVGCIQCHGAMPPGHDRLKPGAHRDPAARPPFHGDRARMMQTCAPCHARNEPLTASFQPGEDYDDHFRVTLPVDPAVFYPDGQQRDEDFDWTSVRLSRMGHAGVTCLDCHDPHSTKLRLPVANNLLCLQCHAAPGRVMMTGVRAVPIDPAAHSHHPTDSPGNSCVECHMPTKVYMQRAPRHDHGWLRPDPLLTKELGIPNACNRCHTDRTVDWAIVKTDEWYGEKMNSHQRARTRAAAAAQSHEPGGVRALLTVLKQEEVPAWRATLIELAGAYNPLPPEMAATARESLKARDPLERAAAVQVLGNAGDAALLRPMLHDPKRLVRIEAEWALSPTLPADSPERAELDAYLALALDQPAGRARLGQDLANRGRQADAERELRLAAKWDPNSPAILDSLGYVLDARDQPLAAAAQFLRAAQLDPHDARLAFQAALDFAAGRKLEDAEAAFRLALQRQPDFARAWYNLGLLYAQTGRLHEAIDALRKSESLDSGSADYPYALATVLLRMGLRDDATAALRRVLVIDPNYAPAVRLLQAQ